MPYHVKYKKWFYKSYCCQKKTPKIFRPIKDKSSTHYFYNRFQHWLLFEWWNLEPFIGSVCLCVCVSVSTNVGNAAVRRPYCHDLSVFSRLRFLNPHPSSIEIRPLCLGLLGCGVPSLRCMLAIYMTRYWFTCNRCSWNTCKCNISITLNIIMMRAYIYAWHCLFVVLDIVIIMRFVCLNNKTNNIKQLIKTWIFYNQLANSNLIVAYN